MSRESRPRERSLLDRRLAASGTQRQRRLTRSVVLGSLAVAAAIAWLAVEWEADLDVLLDYALVSVLLVLLVVALAAAGGALLWAIRRRRRR